MLQILLTLFILAVIIFVPYLLGKQLVGPYQNIGDTWGVGFATICISAAVLCIASLLCIGVYSLAGYLIYTYNL